MPYLLIENFQSGLDTRKAPYTAPPGTLRECSNAHITRGAEVEKRKAFSLFAADLQGTFGLHALRDELYVFGSGTRPATLPGNIQYQRLQHKNDSAGMSGILSTENFNGRVYAIAEFSDGAIYHYYNGSRVTDWDAIADDVADNEAVAQFLASRIDARTDFLVSTSGETLTVTAFEPGVGFTFATNANIGETVIQENVEGVDEALAEGGFDITGGGPSVNDRIDSVLVNGVDVLGEQVFWNTSNSFTAQLVVDQINAFESVPNYSADRIGNRVVVSASPGTGAGPNGFVVEVNNTGSLTVADVVDMAGGVDEVLALVQVVQFDIAGAFDADKQYRVTLDGVDFSALGSASGTGLVALTLDDKVYSPTRSLLYFSGFSGDPPLPDPTAWSSGTTGAGFINMSTRDGGSDQLTALGTYQGQLSVFARRSIQLWDMNADPDANQKVQVLPNLGTVAPGSVVAYGDVDVFFLSESGVRSLRARDSSNFAGSQDVGTPIDDEIVELLLASPSDLAQRARSAIEPLSGRYLLSIGSRVYVFSNFTGSRVSAWSSYQMPGEVAAWAVSTSRLYARVGNQAFVYGGITGRSYDDVEVRVTLPFLEAQNPAQEKTWWALDVGCEGTWEVYMALQPDQPDVEELVGVIHGTTYGFQPDFPIAAVSTHISLRFVCNTPGYARLSNVIAHFEGGQTG